METSGSDGDHGAAGETVRGGGESVSGVTDEAGSSGNDAAAGEAWCNGDGGGGKDSSRLPTARTEAGEAVSGSKDAEEERTAAGEGTFFSPVSLRLVAAAKLGWLLLGFLAGATAAMAVLFLKRAGYPETCTVPT